MCYYCSSTNFPPHMKRLLAAAARGDGRTANDDARRDARKPLPIAIDGSVLLPLIAPLTSQFFFFAFPYFLSFSVVGWGSPPRRAAGGPRARTWTGSLSLLLYLCIT